MMRKEIPLIMRTDVILIVQHVIHRVLKESVAYITWNYILIYNLMFNTR